MSKRHIAIAIAAALAAAGCTKEEARTETVRPVRAIMVGESNRQPLVLAGEVRARYETRLAFRVPGQLVARKVDTGAIVKTGQVLAEIDLRDLRLAESAASAQLAQAGSQAALAAADLKRFSELRRRNFISAAEYDRHDAAAKQASEQLAAARAQAAQAANQAGYGVLVAPHAGVVTAVEAEAGQVMAAGQTVVRVARPEEKEILVAVPEHRLAAMRNAGSIEVRLWSAPQRVWRGKLRELSPAADAASRTYAARIAVGDADAALAWGMSAEVRVHAAGDAVPSIPLTAVFHRDGKPAVWVVEGLPPVVTLLPVTLGELSGNAVAITAGLKPGQVVVTAGVQLLREGQKVSVAGAGKLADARP